jgi:branched-chain amino acid transport system ATP-binding protein
MLEVRQVTKSYAGFLAVSGVSVDVAPSEIVAIIGPNGAGKSTLFNLITGHTAPDSGRVAFKGKDITGMAPHLVSRIGLGRSFQRTNIFPKLTVFENVQSAIIAHRGRGMSFHLIADDLYRDETHAVLDAIGLPSKSAEMAGRLSYGNQKQLELGLALAGEPELLLLDEPTAGMSTLETREAIALVERIAGERGLTVLFTEHDMDVVFGIAHRIFVLHQGRLIASGTPEAIRADPEVRRVYLGDRQ